NTKRIYDNKYGTPAPVPFRVVDRNIGLDVDIAIRCNGTYEFQMTDPILFYKQYAGNIRDTFSRDEITDQLKAELLTELQPAFAQISEQGVRYSAVPAHATELRDILNNLLTKSWGEKYGLTLTGITFNSIKASEEDEARIKELQMNATMRDPNMAAAQLVGAQAQAMQSAAANESAGPMMAFAGMNMASNAGGANAASLFAMGQQNPAQQQPAQPAPQMAAPGAWTCECGSTNNGNFCSNCGKPRPNASWTCSCGAVNEGNFCPNCGKPRA
ncbi:MAG: SPFH domain-containing protein, partial [Lachnospiraceae bacterium]|nr:SPFH domain-containing protein [Lachnospiraceae bacterium]